MPDEAVVMAEPSPASATEVNLATLTPEQRQTWRDTGNLPDQPSKGEAATSDTPEKTTESGAEKAKTTAEPDKATKPQEHADEPRIPKSRLDQEIAKRHKAEERIRELEAGSKKDAKVDPSPAKPAEPAVKAPEAPKRPKQDEFATYEEYEAAQAKYIEDLADYKAKAAIADYQKQQQQQVQQKELAGKLAEARERYPDADEAIFPACQTIFDDQKIPLAVKEMLNSSPVFIDLLYALGNKPEALADFVKTAQSDPAAAIRKAVLTERLVMDELGKPSTKKAPAAGSDTNRDTKAPDKPVTSAPKPPSEVGGRGTAQEDAGVAAARSGDIRSAKAVWDRQYAERHK